MAFVGVPPLPAPLDLTTIEGTGDSTSTYTALYQLQDAYNGLIAYIQSATAPGTTPTGPQNVTATQLDGTIQIQWNDDGNSGADPLVYQVWVAVAGTRSAPTTPNFTQAVRLAKIPAESNGYYPLGSTYAWIDKYFSVTDKDPANPARRTYWVTTIGTSTSETGNTESYPSQAANCPIEVPISGPGDLSPVWKAAPLNKLMNAQFASRTTSVNTSVYQEVLVTNATNANPIQITAAGHGLATNDQVYVGGVAGNTAANGIWTITKVDANNFTLNTSQGNAPYTNGGHIVDCTKYPPFPSGNSWSTIPGVAPGIITLYWTPWYTQLGASTCQWVSDGANYSGEIVLKAPTAGNANGILQDIGFPRTSNGGHFCLSVFAKASGVPTNTTLLFEATVGDSLFDGNFPASLLTTSYQQLVFNFVAPAESGTFHNGFVSFYNQNNSGSGVDITITRPSLFSGDSAAQWTPLTDGDFSLGTVQDPTTQNWSRTVPQIILRDPSAVYD